MVNFQFSQYILISGSLDIEQMFIILRKLHVTETTYRIVLALNHQAAKYYLLGRDNYIWLLFLR